MKNTLILGFLLSILVSCSEDQDLVYSVDPAIEPYVNSFFDAASANGRTIQKENLKVIVENNIQSLTVISRDGDQRILYFAKFYLEGLQEANNPKNLIEANLFHELGKIVLKRELVHKANPADPEPFTLMNSYYKLNGFSDADKEALIAELFD